jgi:hypothetical protein
MAQSFNMPMRSKQIAPIFDGTQARDLPRSFADIEQLFRQANITDDNEKKKKVVYYTDFDTEQLWKYIPEFDDPTSTYADFKDAIMEYYPEAAELLYYRYRFINRRKTTAQHGFSTGLIRLSFTVYGNYNLAYQERTT